MLTKVMPALYFLIIIRITDNLSHDHYYTQRKVE